MDITNLQYARIKSLSKEGFWIGVGQIIAVIGSLVGVRLLTELLSPSEYGVLALAMTAATLGNQVLFWPLGHGATRFYNLSVVNNYVPSYLKAVCRLAFLATGIIVLIILLSTACMLIIGRIEWIAIIIVSFIFAIFIGFNSILNSIQNAARQRSIVALHQGIDSWARFILAAALILSFGATSTIAMVGYILALIFILGSQFIFFRKIIPVNVSDAENENISESQILSYSWPLGAWGILSWAQLSSDRWSLQLFSTTQEVGMYTVLFQLGYYPMIITTGIVTQFCAPIFFQLAGDSSDKQRMSNVHILGLRITKLILAVSCFAFLISLLFHEQIFRVFTSGEYASVSYLLPWMILAGGVLAAGNTVSLDLMSQTETYVMMAPKIVTAFTGIILNFVGAFLYGIKGIVIAFLLFSVFHFLWLSVLSKRLGTASATPNISG